MSGSTSFATTDDPVFAMHRGGKTGVRPSVDVTDRQGLAMAYTPGVARVCTAIAAAPALAADYTPGWPTRSPSSPTARPCSAWGTSARPPRCRSLAFPGVFRGALDTRASDITDGMKLAAAGAIAALAGADAAPGYVIPGQFDERVAPAVAAAVAAQARADAVARR